MMGIMTDWGVATGNHKFLQVASTQQEQRKAFRRSVHKKSSHQEEVDPDGHATSNLTNLTHLKSVTYSPEFDRVLELYLILTQLLYIAYYYCLFLCSSARPLVCPPPSRCMPYHNFDSRM